MVAAAAAAGGGATEREPMEPGMEAETLESRISKLGQTARVHP